MRKSSIALSAAFLASIAAAIWLWSQWGQERARNLELGAQFARLQEHLSHAAPAPGHEAAESAAARASTGTPPAPRPAQVLAELHPDQAAMTQATNPYDRARARLLGNPEYHKAVRAQHRLRVETIYRDLPRVLDLTPEQTARLFDLMVEQTVPDFEIGPNRPDNPDDDTGAMPRGGEERQRQNDAKLRELLGDSGMRKLRDYRESLQSREEVNSLRNDLAASAEPLRADQVESMIDLVHAEQQRLDQEMRDLAATQYSPDSRAALQLRGSKLAIAANQRIIEAARPLLSNGQLAALEDLYRRQKLQMEVQDTMLRLQTEAITDEGPAARSN